jgi:hypothetical protein
LPLRWIWFFWQEPTLDLWSVICLCVM